MQKAWQFPNRSLIDFESIRIESLNADRHLLPLFEISKPENNAGKDIFEFMFNTGPFPTIEPFHKYVDQLLHDKSRHPFAVFSKRLNQYVGTASIMNIKTDHGTSELGSIWYCRPAQRSEVNTQVIFALLKYLLEELGYRRIEWKCHNANQRSKDAAVRLGFTFEGVFRNHLIDKGKNRDTAWYSIIDSEWAVIKNQFETNLLKR